MSRTIQNLFIVIYKGIRVSELFISNKVSNLILFIIFYLNGIEHGSLNCYGRPIIYRSLKAKCIIGDGLLIASYAKHSTTSDNRPCKIIIRNNGILKIGNNFQITGVTICSYDHITIGNNVKIGGGSQVFDTNFHSLEQKLRSSSEDTNNAKTAPVIIGDDVFIGANCIITKGVSIGKNSIIGAGSVVVKDIPANEVWGGNPARCLRKISFVE